MVGVYYEDRPRLLHAVADCIIMHLWMSLTMHLCLMKNAAISSGNKIWFFGR